MLQCDHCQTKNSLDALYCKTCGREVPEVKRDAAREEITKLVAEGYSLMGEGRTEEAEMVAKAALEADPNSPGALSLLGMIGERRGDIVGALDFYERVLRLNPDSPLDKVKVNYLRENLTKKATEPAPVNRKLALVGFAGAVLFMGALGAIVATLVARPAQAATVAKTDPAPEVTRAAPFQPLSEEQKRAMNPAAKATTPAPAPEEEVESEPAVSNPGPVRVAQNRGNNPRPANTNWRSSGERVGSLPRPDRNGTGSVGNDDNEPAAATGEVRPWLPPDVRVTPSGGRDPNEPGVDGGPTPTQNPTPNNPPARQSQGVIDIKRVDGGSRSVGGGSEVDGNGAEAAVKAAREQQQLGNHNGAVRSLEQARKMGRDDGTVNQRLGQNLERMGKRNEAAAAYRRAISQLEQDVKQGKPGAKEKLDSTRQALKNIQGG